MTAARRLSPLFALLVVAACSDSEAGGDTATTNKDATGAADDAGPTIDSAAVADVTTLEDTAGPNAVEDAAEPVDSGFSQDLGGALDTPINAGSDTQTIVDGGTATDTSSCPSTKPFDYKCNADPKTCPGGSCVLGLCVGPKLDQDRWKDCGDGKCGACETAKSCPADCGKPPAMTGKKAYDGAKTVTIWVHGFYNKSPAEVAKLQYGKVEGCGGLLKAMAKFGVKRPCGDTADGAKQPNHMVDMEYYGSKPAAWLSKKDVAEIEAFPVDKGALALQRYALVVAKFAKWRLAISGATHVQFVCHSMGCQVTRHLVENDYEGLASSNKIVRWATNTGVIAGARLARLYDNPEIQKGAKGLGLELSDFVLMNPDYVVDVTATWDHKLYEGNNPLLKGILIHHTAATDPKIKTALNIQLLDLNNPGDEPNDGIMYTLDQHFWQQGPLGVTNDTSGKPVPSTRSYTYLDHMINPKSDASALLAAAGLFHKRKVVITLDELELYNDLEKDNPLDLKNQGDKPAEVAIEAAVRYDPFVKKTFSADVLVHDMRTAHRSSPLVKIAEKQTLKPNLPIFSGPVFDGQTELALQLWLLEMDWYPRFGVKEWLFDPHQQLAAFSGSVKLKDGTFEFKSAHARAVVRVRVHAMY